MNDVGHFVHHHSPAPFLGEVFKTVLGIHMFFCEVAVLILETSMIDGEELTEDLTLHLFYKICKGVAIDEASLFGIVCMEVKVEGESVFADEMRSQLLYCEYGWLLLPVRSDVEAVEVSSEGVHSKMTVKNTINVDHWHHHENKHLSQQVCTQVLFIGEKVDDTFHCVGGRRLPWVHSSCN